MKRFVLIALSLLLYFSALPLPASAADTTAEAAASAQPRSPLQAAVAQAEAFPADQVLTQADLTSLLKTASAGSISLRFRPGTELLTRETICGALSAFLKISGRVLPRYGAYAEIRDAGSSLYSPALQEMADGLVLQPDGAGRVFPEQAVTAGETARMLRRLFLYASLAEDVESMPASSVEESKPQPESWFDDCCFIGHSLVRTMNTFFRLPNTHFYCENGMRATDALNYLGYRMPDRTIGTLTHGLSTHEYKKVYIMYGTNELVVGQTDAERFAAAMGEIIELVWETQPDVKVFLLSVPPVAETRLADNEVFTQSNIHNLNRVLKNLAAYYGCEYLDIFTPLADDNGYLGAQSDSLDGLHFRQGGCDIVKDYLLRHTA